MAGPGPQAQQQAQQQQQAANGNGRSSVASSCMSYAEVDRIVEEEGLEIYENQVPISGAAFAAWELTGVLPKDLDGQMVLDVEN